MKGKPGKTLRTGFGDESAMPVVDYEKCTECGSCIDICPSKTLLDDGGKPRVDIDSGNGCFGCGHCMSVCAYEAVAVTGRRIKPDDAFLLPAREKQADAETLFGLLASRRSVRRFKKQEVDKTAIDRILDMSALAPMGLPPWDVGVTVISGSDKMKEFTKDAIEGYRKMMKSMKWILPVMRLFIDKNQYGMLVDFVLPITRQIIAEHDQGKDHLFYDAPALMIFHAIPGSEGDAMIACTYATIAAQAVGLGTCMIGTVAPFLQRDKALLKKWGIPENRKLGIAMIVGHPDVHPVRGIRRTFSDIRFA